MKTARQPNRSMAFAGAQKLAAEKKIAELLADLQDKTGAVVAGLEIVRRPDLRGDGYEWTMKTHITLVVP